MPERRNNPTGISNSNYSYSQNSWRAERPMV